MKLPPFISSFYLREPFFSIEFISVSSENQIDFSLIRMEAREMKEMWKKWEKESVPHGRPLYYAKTGENKLTIFPPTEREYELIVKYTVIRQE